MKEAIKVYEGVVLYTNNMDWAVVSIEKRGKVLTQVTKKLPEAMNWNEYLHKYIRVEIQVEVLNKKFKVTTKERKHDTDPDLVITDTNIEFEEFKER